MNAEKNGGNEELFDGPGEPREGFMDSDEALMELVQALYPGKPYCLVDNWTIFQAEVTVDELQKIHAAGQLPLVLFAHNVRFDSQRRFDVGDWVRTPFSPKPSGYVRKPRSRTGNKLQPVLDGIGSHQGTLAA